jgi:hypothetical protein
MSHNKITVANQNPDSSGEITVALNNLSDVNTSGVSTNQTLIYSGSAWTVSNMTSSSTMIFVGEGAAQNYNTSGGSAISAGVSVEFYDSNAFNGISSATITSSSNWVSSVTLPVGNYIIQANLGITFSASSGEATYRIYVDGAAVGTTGNVGYSDLSVGSPAATYLSVTSGTSVIDVRIITVSSANTLANQSTRQATHGYFEVRSV